MTIPISTFRIGFATAAAIGLCLAASAPARSDGGGGGGGSDNWTTPSCGRGHVYDNRTGRCVKAENGVIPDKEFAENAYALAKAHRYQEALAVLDLMKDPNTAEALNYRGYATRKLGRTDEGIGYYLRSVALDPHYAKVREYLGEAYLVKGDLASAQAQLLAIKEICGTTCESYEHLAVAIADPADL
jgi:tetratricopeptide (TPR) repeat protein